ncbi:hypothetical protein [Salidesulfovibrio brasiliensis]|uniref:hypothetical protein n=1 Tax=Salidesulfovibrio brasiliensis TaxID=221711 RepID=UPI0006D03E70|nr:hypothetical protein [Salidesulfovibrio brasiliensis]
MPTCKHKPCAVLPAFKGEIGTPKISFYPAQLWDGPEGRWRIMIGDRWVRRQGESRSFFTLDGVTSLVMDTCVPALVCR